MTTVALSLVIPCRDGARRLDGLIARLLTSHDDGEIIVVDASVYDDAARFVCGTFRRRRPRLPLLYLRVTPGTSFAECSDVGTFYARGDRIAVLDLDAEAADALPAHTPAAATLACVDFSAVPGAIGTVVLEAGTDIDGLARKVERALFGRGAGARRVLIVCLETQRAEIETALSWRTRPLPLLSLPAWDDDAMARIAAAIETDRVAFLPAAAPFSAPAWDELPEDALAVLPWVPLADLPTTGTRQHATPASGWIGRRDLLEVISATEFPSFTQLAAVAATYFRSAPAGAPTRRLPARHSEHRPITSESSVAVVIPHYQCEAWLTQCLSSIVRQRDQCKRSS